MNFLAIIIILIMSTEAVRVHKLYLQSIMNEINNDIENIQKKLKDSTLSNNIKKDLFDKLEILLNDYIDYSDQYTDYIDLINQSTSF